MKNLIVSTFTALLAIIVASCNQSSSNKYSQSEDDSTFISTLQSSKDNSIATDTVFKKGVKNASKTIKTDIGVSINSIVTGYFSLKNALVKDDSKAAANAADQLFKIFTKVEIHKIPAQYNKEYIDIADDAKENVEHIGVNANNIEHQLEHFALLSEDLKDLINLLGISQTIYQDTCPMFNDSKGAVWFSETREIKNPYFGSRMINCGKVQQTITDK